MYSITPRSRCEDYRVDEKGDARMDEPHQVAAILLDECYVVFLSDRFPLVLLQDSLFFDAQSFKTFGEGGIPCS